MKEPTVSDIGRPLTEEEVDEQFTNQAWSFIGEDDERILIKCEKRPLPCDRTELVHDYLCAMEEYDGDNGWYREVLARIIEDDPEEVQLVWGKHDGEITWKLLRKTDAEFNTSKYTFWAFVLESDL